MAGIGRRQAVGRRPRGASVKKPVDYRERRQVVPASAVTMVKIVWIYQTVGRSWMIRCDTNVYASTYAVTETRKAISRPPNLIVHVFKHHTRPNAPPQAYCSYRTTVIEFACLKFIFALGMGNSGHAIVVGALSSATGASSRDTRCGEGGPLARLNTEALERSSLPYVLL